MGRLLYLDPTGAARVDRRNKHEPRDTRLDRVYRAYRLLQAIGHNPNTHSDDGTVKIAAALIRGKI